MKKKLKIALIFVLLLLGCSMEPVQNANSGFPVSRDELQNKIKGGWAGQTIGVTYGGPTEFRYRGVIIKDYINIPWDDDYVVWSFKNKPGLYDDVYMDLSFVDVIERLGIDAPADSFATSFAHAGFRLWHANQAARYNILNGIGPPASGHWKNNLHSDCIDFQIEADFAGLMSPGMVNASSAICDKVGHIMNYGDGWYGGVYVAAMYSLAFISDDVEYIVREGLKTIPTESNYYKCMNDVLNWYEKYPDDWKKAWFEIENANWKELCPKGVHRPFNIEATVNSAYVLLGLLYGKGDFSKTLEIAARCGQDSDCNPATCGGILGVIKGYDHLPAYWLGPLHKAEDIPFDHTEMSLNDTYRIGFKHALNMISAHGGKIEGDKVIIKVQQPVAVPLEQSPDNLYPQKKEVFGNHAYSLRESNPISIRDFEPYHFQGTGLVINGHLSGDEEEHSDYVAEVEFIIDNNITRKMRLPLDFITRSVELFWTYELQKGPHTLKINWLNPKEGTDIILESTIVYSDQPSSKKRSEI